jgi:hypothetical protein
VPDPGGQSVRPQPVTSNRSAVRFRFGGSVGYYLVFTRKPRPDMPSFYGMVQYRFSFRNQVPGKAIKRLQINGLGVNLERLHFAHNPLVPSSTLGGPTKICDTKGLPGGGPLCWGRSVLGEPNC